MRRRVRDRNGDSQNLDSLLDTMANVVGILIVLVAVAQLIVGDAMERIVEGAVPVEITPIAVEAAEQQREEIEAAVVSARGELEAMEASAVRDGLLLELAEPLLENLEGLEGEVALRGEDPESFALRMVERNREVRELEEALAKGRERLSKLDELLTGVPPETRPKVARLPDPRPPPREKNALVFLSRYGRVVPVDQRELVEQLENGIQLSLGRLEHGYSAEERAWILNFFAKHRAILGSSEFYWSLQDEGPKSFFAGLAWRDQEAGDSVAELRLGGSHFAEMLSAVSARNRFVQFWVWPDSFEVYLEARYLAESAGFDVAWTPVEGQHPVGVQLLGPRRTQVLID